LKVLPVEFSFHVGKGKGDKKTWTQQPAKEEKSQKASEGHVLRPSK
jgi:hypothetical protein